MKKTLLDIFKENLTELCPEWPEERFVVALSGGLDSTALLTLAVKVIEPQKLCVAHLNHGLRPGDAEEDQKFAEELAVKLKLNFITAGHDVRALAESRKKGLEDAARRARYQFLAEAANQFHTRNILTAHQADDQAETVLMNLLKGSGPKGLAGIPPVRFLGTKRVLRPLLKITRRSLADWLSEIGQNHRHDQSNDETDFLRNKLRLEILPRLCELNPGFIEAASRSAAILREEEHFWETHLDALWHEMVSPGASEFELFIDGAKLKNLSLAEKRRLIHLGLMTIWQRRPNPPEPVTSRAVEMALELLSALRGRNAGLDLPGGLRAEFKKGRLKLGLESRLL